MAGRRRRVSNSTVATFDLSHASWMDETRVLQPLSSNSEDSNDWPCFVLKDAVVLHKDGKRLANPLLIDTEGPFIVRGKLEVDREQRHLLISQVESPYIEIRVSWLYSIGDDPVVLWVSGATGWFEIVPAPQYEAMYKDIREAITLYYVLMDACEEQERYADEYTSASKIKRRKMKPPEPLSLDDLFLKYAVAVGDGIYRHEVEERCHKWAQFLINHFPKETAFDWTGTIFYEWIIGCHPDIQKRRLKAAAGLARAATADRKQPTTINDHTPLKSRLERSSSRNVTNASHSQEIEDVEMRDATATPSSAANPAKGGRPARAGSHAPSQSSRTKVASSAATTATDSSSARATSHASVGFGGDSGPEMILLLELFEEVAREATNFRKVRRKTVQSRIYSKCKIRDYKIPQEIIDYYSRALLRRLPSKWTQTPLYDELEDAANQPEPQMHYVTPEAILPQLARRQQIRTSATLESTPVPARPKPDMKLKPRRDSMDSEDEHSAASRERSRQAQNTFLPRRAGKGAGLRLATTSNKRKASEMEDETSADDVNDAGEKLSTSDDDEVEDDIASVHLAKDAVRVVVHAEKIPSMSPSGPNGTWVCDQEGCGFLVRSAEEEAGKALIQQHFRDHEAQAGMMDLALAESRRGHVPINHLLAKIQAIGQKTIVSERGTLNGETLPTPVKRRLLI